jgi:hypothetical protein
MNPMPDPVIDEIREVRHRISASFDHDPAKLVAYLMQYQKQFHDRLLYIPDEISGELTTASNMVPPISNAVTPMQPIPVS